MRLSAETIACSAQTTPRDLRSTVMRGFLTEAAESARRQATEDGNRATASTGMWLSAETIGCSAQTTPRDLRSTLMRRASPARDLLGRQATEDGDRAIVPVVHAAVCPDALGNERTVGRPLGSRAPAAGPGMAQPHSQSAGREARVAGPCLAPLAPAGDAHLAVEDGAPSVTIR